MWAARATAVAGLASVVGTACCPGVEPSQSNGTLDYTITMPAADASGVGEGPTLTGATSLAVTFDAYEPWKTSPLGGGYCGGGTFLLELGSSCSLRASVGSSYPYAATIDPGQTCGLQLPEGQASFVVASGSVVWSYPSIHITLGGPGANLTFDGT